MDLRRQIHSEFGFVSARDLKDIKLDKDAKKVLKGGLIDDFYEKEVRGFMVRVNKSDTEKIVLKYCFRRTVRTIACVLLAVKKFKIRRLQAKAKDDKSVESEIKEVNQNDVKFEYFAVADEDCQTKVLKFFRVGGYFLNAKQREDPTLVRKYFIHFNKILLL